VKVALLAAISGGSSLSAIHAMQGARLAFDEANDVGGLPVDVLSESRDTK
jgi:ABC-type branched-subunit amino acid transport system substrate-binding protein